MYEIWYAIPCALPDYGTKTFGHWQRMGYKTAALVDGDTPAPGNCDMVVRVAEYLGYGGSVNELCRRLPDAEIVITGGHDNLCDERHDPQKIARQCYEAAGKSWFFLMQPTGDPFNNFCVNHFCGSPWMGREFRRRANSGRGPYWPEYGHYY